MSFKVSVMGWQPDGSGWAPFYSVWWRAPVELISHFLFGLEDHPIHILFVVTARVLGRKSHRLFTPGLSPGTLSLLSVHKGNVWVNSQCTSGEGISIVICQTV